MRMCFRLMFAVSLVLCHPARADGLVGAEVRVQDVQPAGTLLNREVTLQQLVDLCAAKGAFEVEYNAAELTGKVTIRVAEPLSETELWALTNEILASNGLASVRRPGSRIVSIVKAGEAAAAARVERADPSDPDARSAVGELGGYQSVVLKARHRDARELVDAIKQVLSKQTGAVAPVGDGGLILVSDYAARIEQATYLLSLLDVPAAEAVVEMIPAKYVKAQELVTAVTGSVAARDEATRSKLRGKPIASVDGATVILTAPAADISTWVSLFAAFDRPPASTTESYLVRGFALEEVSQLIESSCRDTGPQGSGQRWRIVVDGLTSTLIVTASAIEHAAIDALFGRLAAAPQDARQQVRTFIVRNRSVTEVVEVLAGLLDASANADDPTDPTAPTDSGASSSPSASAAPTKSSDSPIVLSTPAPSTPRSLTPGSSASRSRAESTRSPSGAPSASGSGARTVSRGNLTITTDEGTNSLIVAAEPRLIARIESLLKSIDVRQAQVEIKALVLSITDDQSLDLGVELSKLEISGSTIASLSSLFGLSQLGAGSNALPAAGTGGSAAVLRPGDFSILVRALETLSKGRTLNIPKVLVSNNKQASLTSVLQQPVLSTNASDTVATTSFSGTQDAGTVVTVTPQIAEGDHLLLDYSVEISSFVGDSADPSLPPPRQQNQLKSIVAIPDGHVVAVGGLQIEGDVQGTSQVPLLGDIPLIGEAFKSRSNTKTRSRFYVFIKADILRQGGFEDLKYLSEVATAEAGIDDGFPVNEPRVIK
jgi:general secretion pathway protein D